MLPFSCFLGSVLSASVSCAGGLGSELPLSHAVTASALCCLSLMQPRVSAVCVSCSLVSVLPVSHAASSQCCLCLMRPRRCLMQPRLCAAQALSHAASASCCPCLMWPRLSAASDSCGLGSASVQPVSHAVSSQCCLSLMRSRLCAGCFAFGLTSVSCGLGTVLHVSHVA